MSSRAKRAKASTKGAPAAAAAASVFQPVYIIRCSRESKILSYD
jgi:hypothetical protein